MTPETEKPIQNQCSIQEARKILHNNVFGPEEWKKHFGNKTNFTEEQLVKANEIPWSKDVLRNPSLGKPNFLFIAQPHFLSLGIQKLDDKDLNLKTWIDMYN